MKKRAYKAKTDSGFLDQVSFIVFVVRFNYRVVESKWPQIKKAFYNFDIQKLAREDPEKLGRFVEAPGMIKNKKKMQAVILNAKKCADLQKRHGSVLKWIEHCRKAFEKDPVFNEDLRTHFQEFHGIGPLTSGWLEGIYMSKKPYVEYDMPDKTIKSKKRLEKRHK